MERDRIISIVGISLAIVSVIMSIFYVYMTLYTSEDVTTLFFVIIAFWTLLMILSIGLKPEKKDQI